LALAGARVSTCSGSEELLPLLLLLLLLLPPFLPFLKGMAVVGGRRLSSKNLPQLPQRLLR